MLGLAILFGLFIWIMVTLIAMKIGYKIGKKTASVGRLSEPTFTGFQYIDIINLNSNIPIFQAA